MKKFNLQTVFAVILFTLFSSNLNATIISNFDTTQIFTNTTNIDIDKDGLWDVKLSLPTNANEIQIELAYSSATNHTLLKVNSQQDPTPITYGKNIDMNLAGLWVYSSNGYGFVIQKSELNSSGKYLGIKLKRGNIEYCAWLYLFSYMGEFCGSYAYQNDANSCLKTGEVQLNSSVNLVNNDINCSVFPNPANNLIFIQNLTLSGCSLKIIDMLGKEVLNQDSINNLQEIDISTLNNGVYHYKIIYNGIEITSKTLVKL